MGRHAKQERLQEIYGTVEQKSGVKPADIAREMGIRAF